MTAAMTVLLTRPEAASLRFAGQLRSAGVSAEILVSPVLEIDFLDPEVDVSGVAGVVFTSQHGVASVPGHDLPAWCVGDATAQAARTNGWRAVSARGDADALVRRIMADAPTGPLLHLRGDHSRGDIAGRLREAGIPVTEKVTYRQVPAALSEDARALLDGENPVVLPLFSPRTAEQLVAQGPFAAPLHVVAISETVGAAAERLRPRSCHVAKVQSAKSMIEMTKHRLDAG